MTRRTAMYGDIAIAGEGKALISFKSVTSKDVDVTKVAIETENEIGEIAAWGANNDYPQLLLKNLRLNGAGLSGLKVLTKTHYGSGFVLAKETFEDDKRIITPQSIKQYPEINDFWKRNQMKRFWRETIKDLEYWSLAFPEYILSNDFKKITRVKRQQTANCRFSVMNEKTNYVEKIFLSTKFGQGVDVNSKYVATIPLIDSYWSAEEVKEYCKLNKIRNFVRPLFYPLVDETYYPRTDWHAVNDNGWFEIANSIPQFKKAIFQNQINIKYHIEVSEEYFSRKYGEDWDTFKPEKRISIREKFVDEVDAALRDPVNAGGSIMSTMYKDDTGAIQAGLKITAVDDKYKEGSYLPEASAANSEILFALGVDPSLIGAGIPGGKLGAGSGSDKRESFLILSALCKTNRETTLEPFEFIQEYNGWDDSLIGGFEDTVLTTLDANPTGTEKAAQL
jgi:hypothetical protein